jgi:phage-related protein
MTQLKELPARFFRSESGRQPVRDWLLELSEEDRKEIGDDIRTAEFGWPLGMPLCRAMAGTKGLWEIRTNLSNGRIARTLFCVHGEQMVLLHGFIKKSQKTPLPELRLAEQRMRGLK